MGRVQDGLRGAVVLLELHDLAVGIVRLEIEDVAQVGAPPGVDALVVVADHRQVAVLGCQVTAEQVLGAVGVLVLVDVDLLPAALVLRQHVRVLLEQEHGAHQEVVEVDRVVLAELALIGLVHLRRRLVVVVRRLPGGGRHIGELVLALSDPGQHAGRAEALLVQVQPAQDRLDQRHLVGPVVDGEAPGEADGGAVAPQDPGADGVEGADGRLARRLLADEPGDPLAHLAGRLVGEGDGHDLPRFVARGDEVRDAVSEHPRLPAAGAGQDEERAGEVTDRLALWLVQASQDLLGREVRNGCGGGVGHQPDSRGATPGAQAREPGRRLAFASARADPLRGETIPLEHQPDREHDQDGNDFHAGSYAGGVPPSGRR